MRYVMFFALLGVSAPGLAAGELAAGPAGRHPATVRVTLPADATLTIDGRPTRSTTAERLFVTPPLEAGKRYGYTFRATFVRAGKTVTVAQEVLVQAGREALVSLGVGEETSGGPGARGNAYVYGSEEDTRAYYEGPLPPAPPRTVRYYVPFSGGSERGVGEGRPYVPGFRPIHWGPDPSDPFYHNGQ
jgi:uncharacterized protein (TIGR03000 family)